MHQRPELLGHDRGIDHAVTRHRPATVVGVDEQRAPAQLRARLPEGTIDTGRVVRELAHARERTFTLEEPAGGLPQQFLVVGEVELHASAASGAVRPL